MEDPKPNVPEQEALDEWQQIETLLPQSSSSSISHPKQLELSIPRENYLQDINNNTSSSIFPPSQHGGLDSETPSSPSVLSRSSSPSDDDDDDGLKKLQPSSRRRVLEMLKYGVFGVVLRIRNCYAAAAPGGRYFWVFGSVVGVAVVVAAAFRLYVNVKLWQQGRRRKAEEEWKKGLLQIVMEKDQKINKLLLQISQMNDVISARHKVPVLRAE